MKVKVKLGELIYYFGLMCRGASLYNLTPSDLLDNEDLRELRDIVILGKICSSNVEVLVSSELLVTIATKYINESDIVYFNGEV